MGTHDVMQMLIEVERALQKRDYGTAFAALIEAEDRLLRVERESLARQDQIVHKCA